jgi:hypothetical protein
MDSIILLEMYLVTLLGTPPPRVYKEGQGYLDQQNQLKPKLGQHNTQVQGAIYITRNTT